MTHPERGAYFSTRGHPLKLVDARTHSFPQLRVVSL